MSKPKHPNNLGIALAMAFVIVTALSTLVCGDFPIPFYRWFK